MKGTAAMNRRHLLLVAAASFGAALPSHAEDIMDNKIQPASHPYCRPYLPRPAPLIPVPEGEEPGAAWCGRCAWLYSSPAPSMLPMPMLAISALKLLWCIDDALDNGIFLFFLLLVFSKLSYPSALDVTEPGPPIGFPPRDASIKRRCTESSGAFILAAIGPIVAYR